MRVTIHTETRALLWFAISNGVAHFYFTLLPYLTYEGPRVSAGLIALSVGLACLWLYGVRVISPRLLILWIPCAWLLTHTLIVDGYSPMSAISSEEVIDLSLSDPRVLGDELSLMETLGAGLVFGVYVFTCLRWLLVSKERISDQRSLIPYQVSRVPSPSPKRWQNLMVLYWLVSMPLAIHFWSAFSPIPSPLKTDEDLMLWTQMLWLISSLPVAFGIGLALFRLRPVSRELVHYVDQTQRNRSWRRYAYLSSFIGFALIIADGFTLH